MALSAALQAQVDAWLAIDPDPGTRAELSRLAAEAPERVEALFADRITFGTAGLRAAMGPGPARMNRVVVAQATAGLMAWLPPGARVVIGYDARHHSARFATDTAEVVAGAGGTAELLGGPTPTPVLAHAVVDRRADAGIMITASHNPAADNGYKLYLADGIQLVDPADREIAARIDTVAAAGRDELAQARAALHQGGGRVVTLDDQPSRRHLAAAAAACLTAERDVNVLYTPLHGVAGRHLLAAFEQAGFPAPAVVGEQFEPDPDFPTVAFPNPEEPGALDLALARAAAGGIDLVLANDPDGDRLAVAVPSRTAGAAGGSAGGGGPAGAAGWVRLTGDQVGILLADHLIAHTSGPDRLVASSLVSSRWISALARAEGVADVRTLTGFKWVARPIVDRPEARYLLGYEEALGYCVGSRVRDKDGISAALVVAELVAGLKRQRLTVWDRLDDLARRFGLHATAPVTVRFDGHGDGDGGQGRLQRAMGRVAASPPAALGPEAVEASEDLAAGGDLPPTPGVVWHLAGGARVVVRPSGTEPKLKAYLEVVEPVGSGGVPAAAAEAQARLTTISSAVSALFASLDG